ncbi:MAG: amino acid adenylation domain-containing protein, partial [Burkholderiales bacterium]
IADLPLISEEERKLVLIDWNDNRRDYPSDKCVHELFKAQVEKSPDAIALVFEDEELTYVELNAKSNRLAHHLVSLGVGPDVLVGVCAQRSIEMVAALLAVLKAGAAYLPLDRNYPEERLAFMLEDAAVEVLLTQERVALPRHRAKLVYIDALERDFASYPDTDPQSTAKPDNLAYVIYTSGSTGKPKGVAIEHRSAVALLSWAADTFAPEQWAGVLASTSISFDLSVFELFVPLSVGGAVVLVENVMELPNLACADKVTLVNTVPSAAAELLRIDGIPASVRTVNLAGEPLSIGLVRQFYDKGIERVYDLYGPTEDTTYSTFALRSGQGRATIGRPIANTQIYILDPHLNPTPVGVPGELHIGGAGLARGYLNRPELTAEKFIGNPFSDERSARLYKTGDLARFLPDGNIEFLGRIDHQVKVRGFRIELGEIEAVLKQHPDVKASAVIAREDQANDKRLVAYVVPAEIPHPPWQNGVEGGISQVLRDYLKTKLPEHMLPSAFVVLDGLPLTPNGKLDRKALPAPDDSRPELEAAYVAPRTPIEEKLAAIWGKVLKLDQVGIHDNFFELGGHSLLATRVIARVRGEFQAELQLRALFEMPTVEALSAEVAKNLGGEVKRNLTPIPRRTWGDHAPLSFAQQRLWFLDQFEPTSAAYNMPVALRLTGALNVSALRASLSEIVRRHEALRTTFATADDDPAQVIHQPHEIDLPVIDLSHLTIDMRQAEARRLASVEAKRPFSLFSGPLFRARLIKLDDHQHLLALAVHHIVSDGWSMSILSRELSALYRAYIDGKPSPLAELSIQYADYAIWQRGWFEERELQQQLAYWKKQLDSAPAMSEFTTDYPRPAVQRYQGAHESLT